MKNKKLITLIALMFHLVSSTGVWAASSFNDINSHWAKKEILKLNARGIVQGYLDGTFKADETVTQAQALTMAVRSMGKEKEKDGINTNSYAYLLGKGGNVPSWASGYLAVAAKYNLITASDNELAWESQATRAWISRLMVRMIGKESLVQLRTGEGSTFNDASDIPGWAAGYVAVANSEGLIKGFPGNYFKPKDYVNRGQMVVLLDRAYDKMAQADDKVKSGTIYSIQTTNGETNLILRDNGNLNRYTLTSQSVIYKEKNLGYVTDLIANSQIQLIHDGTGKISFIDILGQGQVTPVTTTTLSGTLETLYQDSRLLVILDTKQVPRTYSLAQTVKVVTSKNTSASLTDLKEGDKIEVTINKDNQITEILVQETLEQEDFTEGIVFDVNLEKSLLILQGSDGTYPTYKVNSNVGIEYKGNKVLTLADVKKNSRVKLTFASTSESTSESTLEQQQGAVTKIEILAIDVVGEYTGQLEQISTNSNIVTVRTADGLKAFEIATNVKVVITGENNPVLANVKVGDSVLITVSSGKVSQITVNNRSTLAKQSGKIVSIDTTNKLIVISDKNQVMHAYYYNTNNLKVKIEGKSNPGLSDLSKDMQVIVDLDDNIVTMITLDNTRSGTVTEIDNSKKKLTIVESNGARNTYTWADNVDVDIYAVSSPDIDDVKIGMPVKLLFSNDKIINIDGQNSVIMKLLEVNTGDETLKFQDKKGNNSTFDVEDVDLVIKGYNGEALTLQQLKNYYNEEAKLTFMGYTLSSVELQKPARGFVTIVSTTGNKITLQKTDGTTAQYELAGNAVIYRHGLNDAQEILLKDVKANDLAQVYLDSEGKAWQVVVAEKISGYLYYNIPDKNQVMVLDSANVYRTINVAETVMVYKGSSTINLSDVARWAQIDIYVISGKLYIMQVK